MTKWVTIYYEMSSWALDHDIAEQELINEIPNAIQAKRLTKRIDGKLTQLRSVLIFKLKTLPEYITLGYEQKKSLCVQTEGGKRFQVPTIRTRRGKL